MIQLNIVCHSTDQADEIIKVLLQDHLAINVFKLEGITPAVLQKNKVVYQPGRIMIIGQTKALLFNNIDQMIRKKYSKNMPLVYSLAIVNMDWEQADLLVQETIKV